MRKNYLKIEENGEVYYGRILMNKYICIYEDVPFIPIKKWIRSYTVDSIKNLYNLDSTSINYYMMCLELGIGLYIKEKEEAKYEKVLRKKQEKMVEEYADIMEKIRERI